MTPDKFDRNKEHKQIGILGNIPKVEFFDDLGNKIKVAHKFDKKTSKIPFDYKKNIEPFIPLKGGILNKTIKDAITEKRKKIDKHLIKELNTFSKKEDIPLSNLEIILICSFQNEEEAQKLFIKYASENLVNKKYKLIKFITEYKLEEENVKISKKEEKFELFVIKEK